MLTILFLALLPVVAFTSCSDDDKDNNESSILGRYYDVECPTDYIELQNGGKFVMFVADDKDGDYYAKGTYVYDAPNITLSSEEGVVRGKISGNTMTITEEGEEFMYVKR